MMPYLKGKSGVKWKGEREEAGRAIRTSCFSLNAQYNV